MSSGFDCRPSPSRQVPRVPQPETRGPNPFADAARRIAEGFAASPNSGLAAPLDSGLTALAMVAGYYRIAADPAQLRHELALGAHAAGPEDLVRAAKRLNLKARLLTGNRAKRLDAAPYPALVALAAGGFAILAAAPVKGAVRLIDPLARTARDLPLAEAAALTGGALVLVTRRFAGAGADPVAFGFRWFLPSIVRYRKPLAEVVVASLFVQAFALATPIFFQLIVDKALVHKSYATLTVIVVGMLVVGLFDTLLQFLRAYTLSHTTNRIDVELGRRPLRVKSPRRANPKTDSIVLADVLVARVIRTEGIAF